MVVKYRQLTFFALASVAAAPASADTLREALTNAYQSNPTLTGAREGQKATNEAVPIAKANGRPDLMGSATYSELFPRSDGTNFTPDQTLNGRAELTVPLYMGGAVKNAVRAAESRASAGMAGLRATESVIFSSVVGAYMDVIRDEAIVELNRAQVGVLQVNLEATRDRFEIGDLTRTDVAQSEARLALATSSMESARANLIRSKENYIQLVGKAPENLEAPPPLPDLPESPVAAVLVALENNPDLVSAKQLRDAAQHDRKSTDASRMPQIFGIGTVSYSNNLGSIDSGIQPPFDKVSTSAQAGVRVTMPIYQGGQPAAQIRQAQARMGQAIEQEIAVERQAIAQTRAAYAGWKASQDVIVASERAVSANELSLEGTRAENSVGNRTILDILNAEQELLNSKVQLVTARRNAYVAGFSLLAAMGRAEARDLSLEVDPLYDPVADYDAVKNEWNDWSSQPDPQAKASRTIYTLVQTAEIAPLP